jgi:MFS family permease
MHDHLGASVAIIGFSYMAWSIPNVILTPFTGRIADRVRRSLLVLIFGLAQVPLYVVYGLANTFMIILILFVVHGVVYAMVQPAVDAHLAASSGSEARGRVQGMYYAFGLLGGFVGSNGFSLLYGLNFRLPLFATGAALGICVLIGAALMRISEDRGLVAGPGKQYEELPRITGPLAEQLNIGYRED